MVVKTNVVLQVKERPFQGFAQGWAVGEGLEVLRNEVEDLLDVARSDVFVLG